MVFVATQEMAEMCPLAQGGITPLLFFTGQRSSLEQR